MKNKNGSIFGIIFACIWTAFAIGICSFVYSFNGVPLPAKIMVLLFPCVGVFIVITLVTSFIKSKKGSSNEPSNNVPTSSFTKESDGSFTYTTYTTYGNPTDNNSINHTNNTNKFGQWGIAIFFILFGICWISMSIFGLSQALKSFGDDAPFILKLMSVLFPLIGVLVLSIGTYNLIKGIIKTNKKPEQKPNPTVTPDENDEYYVKLCEYCGASLNKNDTICPSCGHSIEKKDH